MTPTLYVEAQTFFQEREQSAYQAYLDKTKDLVDTWTSEGWHDARELHEDWRDARRIMHKANAATPCTHTAAERAHEAQRCGWCWTISTYVRLTTPKENDDD